jgi:hypothetical protein
VDNRVDPGVLREHVFQRGRIRDICLVEGWSLAADKLDAIQSFYGGIVKVVDHDDVITGEEELKSREGANVACSPVVSAQQLTRQRFALLFFGPGDAQSGGS